MKQIKLLVIIATALATGAVSHAQTAAAAPAPAPSVSWVLTPTFASQYMFRGVLLGGASFQPSLECDYDALAIGVWSSVPFDSNKVPGQSNPEFDFYGSYKIDAVKDTLNFQPGFTLYTYPRAERSNGFYKATFEPSLAMNYSVGGLTLSPKVYYDVVLKGPTAEFNAAYAVPLAEAGTELDFAGTIGTFKWTSAAPDQGADVKNWGNYWLLGVSMPFQIVKDTQKLTVGFAYTKGSQNFVKVGTLPKSANANALGRAVVTVSYAITF